MATKKDKIKVVLKVDPYAGVAKLALAAVPEGYEFESMDLKGTKATIIYRRKPEAKQ